MTFSVNDSPFAGREGKFVTSRQIHDRLFRETLKDVSLRVTDTKKTDGVYLHLCTVAEGVLTVGDTVMADITDMRRDSIRRNHNVKGASKAYAVLGLTESATEAEIKKAYRKLILEYHPDTIAAKGMADEFKEYATKRFREVQEAYETICRERNIK